MPVFYDFHKVKQLLAIEHLHAEVIQYDQSRLCELGKEPVQGAGDACFYAKIQKMCEKVVALQPFCFFQWGKSGELAYIFVTCHKNIREIGAFCAAGVALGEAGYCGFATEVL